MKTPLIFVSYAREDGNAAARLCQDLRSQGRRIWFDQDSIRGGERWRSAIERAIQEADYFLALLSDISVSKRGTVQAETKKALDVLQDLPEDAIYLIPVRLTPCKPTYPRLHELQWIDLFPSWEVGVEKIMIATESNLLGADEAGPVGPVPEGTAPAPIRLTTKVVRIADLVRAATDAISPYAERRGIGLRLRDEAPAATIRIPEGPVMSALGNVLNNAVKYSFVSMERGATVEVSTRVEGDHVRIDVINIGLGIHEDELSFVFSKFARGREASRHGAGVGLGLSAAKYFLESAQGAIWISSRPIREGGAASTPYETRVTIRLPIVMGIQIAEASRQ